jgi:hypothetical protein
MHVVLCIFYFTPHFHNPGEFTREGLMVEKRGRSVYCGGKLTGEERC